MWIARRLDLVQPPRKAVAYQIAAYDPQRPQRRAAWSTPQTLRTGETLPDQVTTPHRVRFLDADGWSPWGSVIVDPVRGQEGVVAVPSRREYRLSLLRARVARHRQKQPRSPRVRLEQMLARARARVVVLEQRLQSLAGVNVKDIYAGQDRPFDAAVAVNREAVSRSMDAIMQRLGSGASVYVRPVGDTWSTAGSEWLALRMLLRTGLIRAFGTKYGVFTGRAWAYREAVACLPEAADEMRRLYPDTELMA